MEEATANHEHHFDQHLPMPGEARTRWVVCMTAAMTVVEIGPGYRAVILAVESERSLTPPEVKDMIPHELGIAHATVEIHERRGQSKSAGSEGTR
jgi:hypothetical protein